MSTGPIVNLLAQGVTQEGVAQVLRTVRKHLGMDVAFIAHFRETDRVFEHVDADGSAPIQPGQSIPLEEGYCLKIVRGELPELIPDTSRVPAAMAIPATRAIPIGAHLSIPIELSTGEVYGTLCCFSRAPNATLGERDMRLMRALGEVIASRIDEGLETARAQARAANEIRDAMGAGAPRIVYQPIQDVASGAIVGVECLSRFDVEPRRSPDVWFNTAYAAGVGLELELRAIENALDALGAIAPVRFTQYQQFARTRDLGAPRQRVERRRAVSLRLGDHRTRNGERLRDPGACFIAFSPTRSTTCR